MSQRRIKASSSLSPREAQLRRLAAAIPDQAALDRVLAGAKPIQRRAVFERIRPYLRFPDPAYTEPAEP